MRISNRYIFIKFMYGVSVAACLVVKKDIFNLAYGLCQEKKNILKSIACSTNSKRLILNFIPI